MRKTEILESVLHFWPMIWPLLCAVIGWLAKALTDYRKKDQALARERQADRESIEHLTNQVEEMRSDLDAIKAGNIADYQESILASHQRYCVDGMPLTISSRGRVNAMMRSLSALDDVDGTYQSMVNEINALPIYQPRNGGEHND